MAATNPLVLLALKLVLVVLRLPLLELVLLALAPMLDMLALVAQAMEARWLLLPLVVVRFFISTGRVIASGPIPPEQTQDPPVIGVTGLFA